MCLYRVSSFRINIQRQRDDAVATVDGVQRIGVGSGRCQYSGVEVVALVEPGAGTW